jgi:hypothetical protein
MSTQTGISGLNRLSGCVRKADQTPAYMPIRLKAIEDALADFLRRVKSSYYSPIMHFELCKEQQHSQRQELFVMMV